jgi:hypothetical protein
MSGRVTGSDWKEKLKLGSWLMRRGWQDVEEIL